jgi:Flp pilus assembly protein TadD
VARVYRVPLDSVSTKISEFDGQPIVIVVKRTLSKITRLRVFASQSVLCCLALILSAAPVANSQVRSSRDRVQRNVSSASEIDVAKNLIQAGQLDAAEALTRKILHSDLRNAEAHALLGVILDKRGETVSAEQEYVAALQLKPGLVMALSNFAVLLARMNRVAEAIQKFETVLRSDPRNDIATFNLGALYAARGDYKRAIPFLERAAGVVPGKSDLREPVDFALLLTLANAYFHERRQEAPVLANRLEQLAGDDPKALFTLGLSLAEAHQYADAVRLFQRTSELRPQTYEVHYNLGMALDNLERLDDAFRELSLASTLAPNEADPFYRLGLVASEKGDTKQALTYWARALDLRPAFPEVNFMIGEELLKNHLIEKAVPFYEHALAQSRGQLVYYLRLGVAHIRAQHYAQAREVFTKAVEHYPSDANLYFLLGYTNRADGNYDQAVTAFRTALKLQPDNPDALSNLGYIASQRGDAVEAERLLRRAIQLDSRSYASYHDLGRLLVKLKRYDEALPLLRRGAELNDKDPGVHYQLFLAYSRLRQKDEADKELAEFKRLDVGNRHGATPLADNVDAAQPREVDALPPLPAAASGDSAKPKTP